MSLCVCMCACSCVLTVSHVVDAVQVALPFLIIHVLAFGSHDLDGVMAEENLTGRPANEATLTFPCVETVFFFFYLLQR